jgi:PKD repeat protein
MGETVDFTDLSQNDPDSWSWTFDGGVPAQSTEQNPMDIKYDNEGVYDVSLTVENAFGESTEVKIGLIVVVNPVGITEIKQEGVGIYPNPSNGLINLQFESERDRYVKVYSMVGNEVFRIDSQKANLSMDLRSLPGGIYFIRVMDENGSQVNTQKLIIR